MEQTILLDATRIGDDRHACELRVYLRDGQPVNASAECVTCATVLYAPSDGTLQGAFEAYLEHTR